MCVNNDLHVQLYAEDYIRARWIEAENHRMLKQLRKQCLHRDLRPFHLILGRLGRSLISLGERLEQMGLPSASMGEDGWKSLYMSG